jgi:nitrate/nitrite transport system ATP-binding protein
VNSVLDIRGLEKSFTTARGTTHVLGGVDLALDEGEFVAVVGYSGSGKTTLVSLIGGLLSADAGTILLDGKPVTGPGPDRGIVFQQYSLLPWMTVRDNVALAVDAVNPGVVAAERRRMTEELIELVNLTPAMRKRPRELSGGMRQRVAVARGLAMQPRLLLLDEPFSALDALTRATLQDELLRICAVRRATVVMITNDVDEAILLADRIYPMTPGPGAVLGPAIDVALPRPRQRRHMSLTPAYQKARQSLVDFLRHARTAPRPGRDTGRRPSVIPAAPREAGSRGSGHITISDLGKTYDTPKGPAVIVRDFTLDVRDGEFVCLLGHSGCGKTTVLSMLMGLSEPTTGGVVIGGREVSGPGTDRGVVFQSATLLPWLSVRDNVGLARRQVARREGPDGVLPYLAGVGLDGLGDPFPRELSAGMQQRVGTARAFSLEPRLLLLDEPFSLLDALTRMELQDELMSLWEARRKTVVMVTHDVDEALLLADRIVMMTNGPAATIGEIFDVPFARPRRREAVLADAQYFLLRDAILGFLEERAARHE